MHDSKLLLYADPRFRTTESEVSWIGLARAQWDDLSYDQRSSKYGPRATSYEFVLNPAAAEFHIFPLIWDDVLKRGLYASVQNAAQSAASYHKRLIIWSGGDAEDKIPIPNTIVIADGPNKIADRPKTQFVITRPYFSRDYLQIHYSGILQERRWANKPVVGFCGYAASSVAKAAAHLVRSVPLNILNVLQLGKKFPPPLIHPAQFRANVLRVLANDQTVETNFLIRDRYQWGIPASDNGNDYETSARLQFVHNIIESDYTVCVRGGGNFSARFYETLACGRIPIFVNTNCLLPFPELIDWKKYCVWVEADEISQIGLKVISFHQSLKPDEYVELQYQCRKLWEEWLFVYGFYERLVVYLHNLSTSLEPAGL